MNGRLHCRPGDEFYCEATSHVYLWEAGAPAALSGVACRMIDGDSGVLTVRHLEGKLHPPDDEMLAAVVKARKEIDGGVAQK